MDSSAFNRGLPSSHYSVAVLLASWWFATTIGWVCGNLAGRCEATCAAEGMEMESNAWSACWCEGQEQPVKALGGSNG